MICNQCGCKVPDGVFRCRVCGSTELVMSRSATPMDASFGRGADLGAARGAAGAGRCATCGRPLSPGMRFCNGCGTRVVAAAPAPSANRCRACGKVLAVGARFCNGCGARVVEPVDVAPAVAPAPAPVAPAPVVSAPVEPRFSAGFKPAYMVDELGAPETAAPVAEEILPPVPVVEEPPVVVPEPVVEIPAPAEEIPAYMPTTEETKTDEEKTCAVCGRELLPNAGFCPYCGATWVAAIEPVAEEPKTVEVPAVEIPVVEIAVTEEPVAESRICPVCGKSLSAEAMFCNGCGASLVKMPAPVAVDTKTCPICGKELSAEAKFCNGCGAKLDAAPAPAPVPEPATTQTCPVCGKELSADMKFCNSCGADLRKAAEPAPTVEKTGLLAKKCHVCGNEIPMGARFCNSCGADSEYSIDSDSGVTEVLPLDSEPVAPVVMVTDPHVKGAEKTRKAKKPKKEKPAGKKSKKGLVIGIVLAVVLVLAATAVTVWLVDPFNWYESAEEKAAVDEAAGKAAMECMDKFYNGNMEEVLAGAHEDVVSNGNNRERMMLALLLYRTQCMPANLSANVAFEVKSVDKLTKSDLEELQQTYSEEYDLEIQDARKVKIESQITYTQNGENKEKEASSTLLMCLIDGKWYIDVDESQMVE